MKGQIACFMTGNVICMSFGLNHDFLIPFVSRAHKHKYDYALWPCLIKISSQRETLECLN